MAEISLSNLFKSQIKDVRLSKLDVVKITNSFKRVERLTNELLDNYGIEQLVIKIKATENKTVVFKIIPPTKIIVKKIMFG